MPLIVRRKLRDTWRNAVAARSGTDAPNALAAFDALVAEGGADEAEAAYRVLAARGLAWRADEPGATAEAVPREAPDA